MYNLPREVFQCQPRHERLIRFQSQSRGAERAETLESCLTVMASRRCPENPQASPRTPCASRFPPAGRPKETPARTGPSPQEASTEPQRRHHRPAPARPAHRGQHPEVLPGQVPQHHHVQLPHGRSGRGAGMEKRGKEGKRSGKGRRERCGGKGSGTRAARAQQRLVRSWQLRALPRSAGSRRAPPATEPGTRTETQGNSAPSSAGPPFVPPRRGGVSWDARAAARTRSRAALPARHVTLWDCAECPGAEGSRWLGKSSRLRGITRCCQPI